MEISVVVEEKKKKNSNPFPLSSYLRIANQLIQQANVYRSEGNIIDLLTILHRYCRLVAKIPQHSSYSTYSAKEKLHHEKILQEFLKELETLKSQLCQDSWTPKAQRLQSSNEVMCDGAAETKNPSVKIKVNCVTQSSPSPVLTYIQSVPEVSQVSYIASDSSNGRSQSSCQDVHISVRLMDDFLELARDNTNKDLETCGLLGAFLKKGIFYVTTLIIPKQEATSSSCQALSEEEIYAIQSEHSLFPLGWIHTHPSQTCFMSSIDLHTQYCYQIMLPEAVAIVMAPKDSTRRYGIFRITEPGGTSVLKECEERGFHTHQEPPDGSPLYEDCSNVYFNPNLRFEIFDLR